MARTSSVAGEARRLGGLDSLRGLGALGVLAVHVWLFWWGDRGRPTRESWELALGELRLALPYFFVLSGFLLMGPWIHAALGERNRPRLGSYALRRVARVVPAFIVSVIGSILLLYGTGNALMPPTDELWRYFLFLHNQDPDTVGKLNPPLWSLGVEAMYYVALPIAGVVLLRLRSRRALGLFLAALVVAACGANELIYGAGPVWQNSLAAWFGYFALGGLAVVLMHGHRPPALPLLAAGWALVVANGVWHTTGSSHAEWVLRDLPAGAGFAMVIAGIAAGGSRLLELAPFRGLGTVSYGLYVWHFPVILWLRLTDRWPESLAVALLLAATLTLTMAVLSWYLVERPALNWARARTARTRQPRPATTPPPRSAPQRSQPGARPAEGRA
jgi:peptidoglycan/LPS O-acetylase OafA/YrhL